MATALVVASTVIGAASAIQEGRTQDKISKYNAAVAEQTGTVAKQKAEFDEAIHRERVRSVLSSQRVAIGKAGVELTGSPLLALEESARVGELDALAIRFGGEVEKSRALSEAAGERFRGKAAKRAGVIRAGTTLLSGGARVASRR